MEDFALKCTRWFSIDKKREEISSLSISEVGWSLSSKKQLMRSFVASIFLYACKSWTLTAELQRRIQAMGMRCYRKILRISHEDHVTNEEVRAKIQQAIGPHAALLTIVRRDVHCSGMVMSPVHQVWPKPSCNAQWKGEEDKADRRRGWKTTSGNGQAWSSPSPRGQWRTGGNGRNWMRNHL